MKTMICYIGGKDNEIFICPKSKEKAMIKLYFSEPGRDIEEYDRTEMCDMIHIEPQLHFRAESD